MTPSTTSSTVSHSLPAIPFASKLSEQLSQRKEQGEPTPNVDSPSERSLSLGPPLRPSPKSRSLSDAAKPASSHQPTIEEGRPSSKDDTSLSSTTSSAPETPQRPTLHPGLSSLSTKPSGSPALSNRTPLSPKLDPSHIYGSPGSVLPRRSRGLDFSRACTNLHHSTLAESSPDSSPIVGGRGMAIPQRRGSPGSTSAHPFSTSGPADKTTVSSSVSSVNMMESDTSSSEDDEETMMQDRDDMIMNTPQASKMGSGPSPFAQGNISSPGNDWMGNYSQAAASLASFQRARFRTRRSRHSSSSNSGNSSKPSPGPFSPPVMNSIENQSGGYFSSKAGIAQRRESLSLGTRDLRLSDLSDEGESRAARAHSPSTSHSEGGPLGVIRRAVTRRGSLLPKTKTFARIRAALMEESAPIDCEAKREAEVIRQVRESEPEIPQKSPSLDAFSNINPFQPAEPKPFEDMAVKSGTSVPDEPSFSDTAHRNSRGAEFWNTFDERYRTPPPPPLRQFGTSISEDDSAMDMTPSTTTHGSSSEFAKPGERPSSRCSTSNTAQSAAIAEIKRKRRRDDDFDPNLFKRRAVSPSMSVQSSPVMPNSPAVKDSGANIWGPPKSNLGSLFPERPGTDTGNRNSAGAHSGTLKRVGLQGMNETNDGLMNMTIE